jgi:group I intron endonuclease
MKTKNELKNIYKEMKSQVGVFQIRNTVNRKIFIGSSTDLKAIWNRIRAELKFGTHANKILQQEWNELGEPNFVFEILSEIKQDDEGKRIDYRKEAKELENMFIKEIQPFGDKGYNVINMHSNE